MDGFDLTIVLLLAIWLVCFISWPIPTLIIGVIIPFSIYFYNLIQDESRNSEK